MGDRYTLQGKVCPYCEKEQDEVYYAESSGFLTHKCEYCKKESIITMGFALTKATKKEIKQLYKDSGFGE